MVLALCLAWSAPALATPVDDLPAGPYAAAVDLVERLFLEPGSTDEIAMLHAAADGAARDLRWLRVMGPYHRSDPGDHAIVLLHGNGAEIGRVTAESMADLPAALERLERLITASGYETDGVDVKLSVLSGMATALDRYSRILADEKLDRFNVRLSGTLVGIGATFGWSGERLAVSQVLAGGPGEMSGLRLGDEILRIDGRSTVSMPLSEATRRVRGEEGTQVVFVVGRDGPDGITHEHTIAITRAEIVVPNVTARVLPGDVGYVFIDHVSQRTVENLVAALAELEHAGALGTGLVIDLRGNTGGSMKESANVADAFLTQGLLLRTEGKGGERVPNLQSEMVASAEGTEPQIPIVVVVDERTASGAEILAGALVELGRAAVVGTRTYGKGTVQKIYPIEPGVRFKLTVARYILANGRAITDDGIVPDVVLGRIDLDAEHVRFVGWDESRQQVGWNRILPDVHTSAPGDEVDLPVELARRAVLQTVGIERSAILASLHREAEAVRIEEEARLRDALVARGIDWTPDPAAEDAPGSANAVVQVRSERIGRDSWNLVARVTNPSDRPLHQVMVQLDCPSVPWWDDVVLPIGRVAPGATGTGTVRMDLPPGVEVRQDAVDVRLRADRHPPQIVGEQILDSGSAPPPVLQIQARLVAGGEITGPHGHPVRRAEVLVQNLSDTTISGVDLHFGFPGSDAIELLDHGARATTLAGGSEQRLELTLEVGPEAPAVLPLELVIEAEGYGPLVEWPLSLPVDGALVLLQAPQIEARPPVRSAPTGPFTLPITVTDDRLVQHVVVSVNGEKVAWSPGEAPRVQLSPVIELAPGDNRIVVQADDDQGIRTSRTVSVRGDASSASVDAGPEGL